MGEIMTAKRDPSQPALFDAPPPNKYVGYYHRVAQCVPETVLNRKGFVYEMTLVQWLDRNMPKEVPGRCCHCNGAEDSGPLLPFGVRSGGYAWVHDRCGDVWRSERRRAAVVALAAMGITPEGVRG